MTFAGHASHHRWAWEAAVTGPGCTPTGSACRGAPEDRGRGHRPVRVLRGPDTGRVWDNYPVPAPAPRPSPDDPAAVGVPSRAAPSINADPGPVPGARRLAGRYRLESVLGRGSMGTVWAATDEVLHRPVAIKQINVPPGMPTGEVARLRERTMREARAVAALCSPYVVTVFDVLTPDAGPVIVMELFRGRSLARRHPRCRAVDRRAGRDRRGGGRLRVAGGARRRHHPPGRETGQRADRGGRRHQADRFRCRPRSSAEPTITGTGMILGSAAYLAPEVATGTPVGPLSDAWSLSRCDTTRSAVLCPSIGRCRRARAAADA